MIQDTEISQKNLGMELVRVTEAAALACGRLMGRGDQEEVRSSAAAAMGQALRMVNMDADIKVVVGTPQPGEDLVSGLHCGQGHGPRVDLAIGPLDGISLVARGLTGAMAVLAATERGRMRLPGSLLLEKIAVGPRVKGAVDITDTVENNLNRIAFAKKVRVSDLTIVILDRPRHQQILEEARNAGARVTLISDGEVSAAIRVAMEDSGVDAVMGIGGAEDATVAACALKCLAGELVARPWLRNEEAAGELEAAGVDPHRAVTSDDLAGGDEVVFAATGVTDGLLLRGVHYHDRWAESQSLVMRSASGTVRKIETQHHYARALAEALQS
ncbi:MAG: fructose-bisphosphatase class II family protein [Candidatus Dormiibacterota bacterium]